MRAWRRNYWDGNRRSGFMKACAGPTSRDGSGMSWLSGIGYAPVTSNWLFCFMSLVISRQVLVLELRTRRDAQLYEEYACGRPASGRCFLYLCACPDEGGSWRPE